MGRVSSLAEAQEKTGLRGGTLKVLYMELTHLNPAIVSGTPTGVPGAQLFAGLLQFDEKFQPRPYLATKWDVSPAGRIYTSHLPKGATFHDGKPITSADAAFSLETVEVLKAVRKDFGLDKTLAEQLFIYGKKVLSGDLGFSYF